MQAQEDESLSESELQSNGVEQIAFSKTIGIIGPMVSYVGLVQTLCTSNIDHHRHFELDYSPVAPQNLSARALFELDYSPVYLDNCPSGINM